MRDGLKSVLIVEDEAISALYLKLLLSAEYRIAGIARSGNEAIAIAEREGPDIVIMDVHLDGVMDGVEAARHIRERQRPRVVFCSAYSREEIGDPVGAGLGEALLSKPIQAKALLELLAEQGSATRRTS
jgi:CheY-like chemotaxis protein